MKDLRYRAPWNGIRVTGPLIVLCLCTGCVSLMEKAGKVMEKAGKVLDGSAFAEKTVFMYRTPKTGGADTVEVRSLRDRAGEWSISVSLGPFPMMKLRGTAPDARGNFTLSSLDYLAGGVSGWNEYRLEITGAGSLVTDIDTAAFTVSGAPEAGALVSGRIHRYDTRITSDEALASLRNRRERVLALTGWMRGRENAPRGLGRKEFEKYWKPVLLPETVSKKLRPAGWQQAGDQTAKAEDIRWNTGYTERVFPEELWTVRNSGTLLRDWEEALSWIYLEYEWERIAELLSRTHTLQRIK